MRCEEILELATARATGEDPGPEGERVDAHLRACAECRRAVAEIERLWSGLAALEEEPPSAAMRARLGVLLSSEAGIDAGADGLEPRPERVLRGPWSRRTVAQIGLTLAAMLAGVALGIGLRPEPVTDPQLAALQQEVQSLNELVSLSLLQQGSASDRIRGARHTTRLARLDDRVTASLIATAAADPDVNVRLAAVGALAAHADRPAVRDHLLDALRSEGSPLVQIVLVELLLAVDGDEVRAAVASLLEQQDLHPEVKRFIIAQIGERA